MDFRKFKGIIFDMDGTLIDSSHVWSRIDEMFMEKRGLAMPDDYYKKLSAMNFQQGAEYTIERFGLDEKPEDIVNEWFNNAVHEYENNVFTKDGVYEFLKFLKENGVKIALATASSESLYTVVLKSNGIYDMFDFFASTDLVERGKGFPDVYEYACKGIGLKPEDCAVFEDIIEGVRGAKAGNFTAVACLDKHYMIDWGLLIKEADYYFSNYNDFLEKAKDNAI